MPDKAANIIFLAFPVLSGFPPEVEYKRPAIMITTAAAGIETVATQFQAALIQQL